MQKEIIIIAAGLLVALGSAYYVFSPGDDPSEEPEIEIELLSEPVTGESNTVQAQENGTALAGETLYLNGEEYGELNDAGITEFTTPDTEELTLEVSDTTKTIAVNETDEVDEEPEETELVLDSEPEVGEMNRVLLYINGERTSGETIYLNNEELGETSNTGTITFTVPNEEQLTLSTDLEQVEDKTVTPEGYEDETEEDDTEETNETEEETREGLELRNDPVAEEHNTITLYQNNEPVEDETIYINDEEIGATDEFGELDFQVPNEEEITLDTDINEISSVTEQTSGFELEPFNLISPEEEEVIDDYFIDLNIGIDAEQSVDNYELRLNGETKFESTENISQIDRDVYIEQSGNHELYSLIEIDGEIYESETLTFETTQDMPEPELEIEDIDVVDGFRLIIELDVEAYSPYIKELSLNGETRESDEFDSADQGYDVTGFSAHHAGDHDLELKVEDAVGREFDVQQEFETTEDSPWKLLLDIGYPEGEDHTWNQDEEVRLMSEIETFDEDIDGELWIDDGSNEQLLENMSFDDEQTTLWEYEDPFDEGDYEWWIELESQDSNNSFASDEVELNVE